MYLYSTLNPIELRSLPYDLRSFAKKSKKNVATFKSIFIRTLLNELTTNSYLKNDSKSRKNQRILITILMFIIVMGLVK
jgi:hypothetical protein